MAKARNMKASREEGPLIGVVGPCAVGKTTLVDALTQRGYRAKQIAQEHSYVQRMWRVMTHPDVLVYLDASYESCTKRKNLNWTLQEYQRQIKRLAHARRRCDVYVNTEGINAQEALERVLEALEGLISP